MPQSRKPDSNAELSDEDEDDAAGGNSGRQQGRYDAAQSTVTLSGLLNAIDGVSSQEDCILFATTLVSFCMASMAACHNLRGLTLTNVRT